MDDKKKYARAGAHDCPKCSKTKFMPAVRGGIGGLYYFLAICCNCNAELQCCRKCNSWDIRNYGNVDCMFCKKTYYMPTIEEEIEGFSKGYSIFMKKNNEPQIPYV